MGFAEMTGHCRPVLLAEHQMNVKCGLAGGSLGHVTEERGHLDLFCHQDPLIFFPVPVEIQQDGVAEGTDGGELCRAHLLGRNEALQASHYLLAGIQDHRIRSLSARLMQKLVAHLKASVTKPTASGSEEFLDDRGC